VRGSGQQQQLAGGPARGEIAVGLRRVGQVNVYDALLTNGDTVTRAPFAAGTAQAPQFEPGRTNVGLMAEHGFSALVTVRRGDSTTSVLFDTGLSPDAKVTNAGRLGLDLTGVHAVVLSHGHFDHAGGLAGRRGPDPCR
jgi:7,8-dihydropterin-6-yl-methyl-4-(beta-D-ribofuranosyl)aminobenzene 5'-phosphate synthase